MTPIETLLEYSNVHPQWRPLLVKAGERVDQSYLRGLIDDSEWLPGRNNLFAAFRRDLKGVDYLLFGESPYPRKASANGIAFYDAAVEGLWSDTGLSKQVNKATSLRNILKAALIAEGRLSPNGDGKIPQALVAAVPKQRLVQTIGALFDSLADAGFLMFNATPVLHADRKPNSEAKFWLPFLQCFLAELLKARSDSVPTLILWGKIAEQIKSIPCATAYPQLVCEHPYNLSFIKNAQMQLLFRNLTVLESQAASER